MVVGAVVLLRPGPPAGGRAGAGGGGRWPGPSAARGGGRGRGRAWSTGALPGDGLGRRRPDRWSSPAARAAAAYLAVQRLLRAPELDADPPAAVGARDGRRRARERPRGRRAGRGRPTDGPGSSPWWRPRTGPTRWAPPSPPCAGMPARRRGAGRRRRVDRRHRRRRPARRGRGSCACPRTWARAGRWRRAWPPARRPTSTCWSTPTWAPPRRPPPPCSSRCWPAGPTWSSASCPAPAGKGGFGLVRGLAAAGIRRACGFVAQAPALRPAGGAGRAPAAPRPRPPLRAGDGLHHRRRPGRGPGGRGAGGHGPPPHRPPAWPASPTGAARAPTSSGPCGPGSRSARARIGDRSVAALVVALAGHGRGRGAGGRPTAWPADRRRRGQGAAGRHARPELGRRRHRRHAQPRPAGRDRRAWRP